MRQILIGQLDYIYFFYGLSFILLSIVCFYIRFYRESRLAWFWLGLFSAIHGIHEWLDLFAVSLGDSKSFEAVRLVLLALSYLSLIEFGRRGLRAISGRHLGLWIYFPAIILAFSGILYGVDGLGVSTRYFVGLFGCFFAAAVIYGSAAFETGTRRIWLIVSSVILGLFSLTSGMIVPPAPFFPASWLNIDRFLEIFGFPVQYLRGLLALFLAAGVWQYLESLEIPATQIERFQKHSRISKKIIVAILCVVVGLGWIFTYHVGKYSIAAVDEKARTNTAILINQLSNQLRKADHLVQVLSSSPHILAALVNKNQENVEKANSTLDMYRMLMGISVCFLADPSGTIIASSNRRDSDSLVGKLCGGRPYFQDALSVGLGRFIGIDAASPVKGYYAAYPVRDVKNRPVGVVVVKESLSDEYFTYFPYVFLVDQHGIVFLSSKPEYLFKALWPVDEKIAQSIRAFGQFGNGPFDALTPQEIRNGDLISFNGKRVYAIRQYIEYDQWSVLFFASTELISQYRLFGISVALFICLLIIGFFFTLRHTENLLTIISSINIRFKEILGASTQTAIMGTDLNGMITIFNSGAEKMLGYTESEVVGKFRPKIFHLSEEIAAFAKKWSATTGRQVRGFDVFGDVARHGGLKNSEWTFVRKDGSHITVDLSITAQRNPHGAVTGFLAVAIDITERKQTEERIRQLAYHDILTGLPNRALFNDRLQTAIAQASRTSRKIAIMMLDLDKFKQINDTLGHPMGDVLLKGVAERLRELLRKSDTIARMGGDEFMILLPEIERVEASAVVAWKIVEAFKNPFQLDTCEVNTTTSIGIAIFPDNGENADVLIRNADIALYQAKGSGGNRVVSYSSRWR